MGDAGLTGRKIVVDTYGGAVPHGGGAFSGKDPTKVDRSAPTRRATSPRTSSLPGSPTAACSRWPTRSGSRTPSRSTSTASAPRTIPLERIEELVREHFDLRPAAIVRDLDLRRPIYTKTAAYGHFGRDDPDFTWERTRRAEALREAAGLAADAGSQRAGSLAAPCAAERLPGVRRGAQPGRTNSPAAARSPIAVWTPSSRTRSWPAAGSAASTSICAPGTRPWS